MIGSAAARRDDETVRRLVVYAACIALLMALLDLIGWWAHVPLLTSVFRGYATMKPNTAACLALIAVAVLLTPAAALHSGKRKAAVAAAPQTGAASLPDAWLWGHRSPSCSQPWPCWHATAFPS